MGDENKSYRALQTLSDRNVLLKFADTFVTGNSNLSSTSYNDLKALKLCLEVLSQPHAVSSAERKEPSEDHNYDESFENLLSNVVKICNNQLKQLFHHQGPLFLNCEINESKDLPSLLIDIIILCLKISGLDFIRKKVLCELMDNILKRLSNLSEFDYVYQADISEMKTTEMTELLRHVGDLLHVMPCETPEEVAALNENVQRILDLLHCSDYKITTFVMVHLFPVIVALRNLSFQLKTLKYIWDVLCSMFSQGSAGLVCEKYVNAYVMLCSVCSLLFTEGLWLKFPVHNDVLFWKILHHGFMHENCLTRKRTLYVFKGLLSCVENSKIDICGPLFDEVPIFFWKVKWLHEVKSVWEDIILLFEVYEEKQIHVVKPLLSKLNKVVKATAKSGHPELNLHTSWLVLLYRKLLCHDSKSIAHWTVAHVLELNFVECPVLEQSSAELFICSVIEALNNMSLYARHEQKSTDCITWQNVADFLNQCCDAFSEQDKKVLFLQHILHISSHQSWSGVALLYFSCALSKIRPFPAWEKIDFPFIRELVYHSKRTQEPLLRGAMQCYLIRAVLCLMNCKDVTFEDLSELLSVFKGNESLIRHTSQWSDVSSWLSCIITSENYQGLGIQAARLFCTNSIEHVLEIPGGIADDGMKRLSHMIVLHSDAGVMCFDTSCCHSQCLTWTNLIAPIAYNLLTAPTRPYLSSDKFLKSLMFYCHLLRECKGYENGVGLEDQISASIIGCLEDPKDIIQFLFHHVFDTISSVGDITKLKVYVKSLYSLSGEKQLHSVLMCLFPSFMEECLEIMKKDCSRNLLPQLWKALAWICHFLFSSFSNLQNLPSICRYASCILVHVIEEKFLTHAFKKPDFIVDNISKAEWIKLTNEATKDAWFYVRTVLTCLSSQTDTSLFVRLSHEALETLNIGARDAVATVFSCMKLIIPEIIEDEPQLMSDVVAQGWKSCLELRRSDLFRPTLPAFVDMVFQPKLMKNNFANIANKYVKEFKEIGESSSGIYNTVVDHCCRRDFMNTEFDFISLIVDSLTFGPIHRKDQRIIEDAVSFVAEQGSDLSINELFLCDYKSDTLVRVKALNFIRSMKPQEPDDRSFAMNLVMALIKTDKKLDQSHSVYFGNSLTHRMKNRVWQSVLLLQPFLSQDANEAVLMKTYESLTSCNQQPSFRYLQEWVVFKIIYSCPALLNTLSSFMEKAMEKRQGCITSFLSILVHLSHHTSNLEKLASDWIPKLISYCMTQNFNTKVYAQVALEQLWHLCESKKLNDILEKYAFVSTCLQSFISTSNTGNTGRNRQKLSEDFYFKNFDPIKDFTIQTVFYELPRLSNLTREEWISPSVFHSSFADGSSSFVDLWNSDNRIQDCNPSLWLTKSAVDVDSSEDISDGFNFQKKITPWTQMISEIDISLKKKPPISDGLVVVASLIDKAPNLGGLCRTSEVFGVSEFVIGSLKYIEDKQFQNLAVTANKWITITEVKPHHLKDYLLSLKAKGYTLIGAEQTDDSQPLTKYVFPKKSVILLGNEKEGLPVDLIQVLDVCVQIPQQGIIRSLNVHVCGAILIWEYACQHIINEKS